MASYDEARVNEFTAAATKTITGVPLEPAEQSALISDIGRTPIHMCVKQCFAEPCPCDGPIVWIEEGDIRERVSTERQTMAGEDLYDFKIDLDATVLVESVVRMKAGDLGRAGAFRGLNPSSHLPAKGGCGCGSGSDTVRSGGQTAGYHVEECAGHTLYDVYVEATGVETVFYYTPIGSC
jgi:hypothetical protein